MSDTVDVIFDVRGMAAVGRYSQVSELSLS